MRIFFFYLFYFLFFLVLLTEISQPISVFGFRQSFAYGVWKDFRPWLLLLLGCAFGSLRKWFAFAWALISLLYICLVSVWQLWDAFLLMTVLLCAISLSIFLSLSLSYIRILLAHIAHQHAYCQWFFVCCWCSIFAWTGKKDDMETRKRTAKWLRRERRSHKRQLLIIFYIKYLIINLFVYCIVCARARVQRCLITLSKCSKLSGQCVRFNISLLDRMCCFVKTQKFQNKWDAVHNNSMRRKRENINIWYHKFDKLFFLFLVWLFCLCSRIFGAFAEEVHLPVRHQPRYSLDSTHAANECVNVRASTFFVYAMLGPKG